MMGYNNSDESDVHMQTSVVRFIQQNHFGHGEGKIIVSVKC